MSLALGLALGAGLGCRPPAAPRPEPAVPAVAPAENGPNGADLIYFVMVDRFADGRPDAPGSVDRADPHAWQGGDLSGLIGKLDHLAALGVRTVWISPVFESRQAKIGEWGAFHGYWVRELAALEPRLATPDELRALSAALHARGMRLVMDVVWNHTADEAPLRAAHPDWFHQRGDIRDWDDPVERVEGDVHGLPDLRQELQPVEDHLFNATLKHLQDANVDGVRVDAVRHMPLDALRRLNARLDAARGPAGVWAVGEDFTGSPTALQQTLTEGGFDAVFDFSLRYALIDSVCGGAPPARLASTLSLDRLYEDTDQLVTFLDNHDLPRLMSSCGGDEARADQALLLLFSLRGRPCLTFGTEALPMGAGEPENRAMVDWTMVGRRTEALAGLQAARQRHPSLRAGAGRALALGDDHLLWAQQAPSRPGEPAGELSLIVLNRRAGALDLPLPEGLAGAALLATAAATGGPLRLNPQPGPALERLRLDGPGVGVWVLRPPPGFALPLTSITSFPIEAWAEVGPGERLLLVGAAPELGAWSPAAGLPLTPPLHPGGPWTGAAPLPAGAVPAFKLVRLPAAGGAPVFEPGADRSPLLPETAAPLRLRWGETAAPPSN